MRIREFARSFRFARINRCLHAGCRDWLHGRRFFLRVGKLGLEILVLLGEGIPLQKQTWRRVWPR